MTWTKVTCNVRRWSKLSAPLWVSVSAKLYLRFTLLICMYKIMFLFILLNLVSIVTRLRAWRSGVRIPVRAIYFPLCSAHTCSGAHPSTCSMRIGIFSRVWSGRSVNLTTHLNVSSRLWMSGVILPLLLCAFMAWRKTLHFNLFLEWFQAYFITVKNGSYILFFSVSGK